MGLDTSHDCWHGAYSAVTRWRNTVAEIAGYPLVEDENGQHVGYGTVPRDWVASLAMGSGGYSTTSTVYRL